MTPPCIKDPDFDVAFIDALSERAIECHAHPRIRMRLLVVRNEFAKREAARWGTRPVTEVK